MWIIKKDEMEEAKKAGCNAAKKALKKIVKNLGDKNGMALGVTI